MWKWLHSYAKPERSYQLAGKLWPWFAVLFCLLFALGTVWGLLYVPVDYQQKDSFRIIYIHVPSASMSMAAYASMAIAAFVGLVWQQKQAFISVAAMAPVGAGFTVIALVTGSFWGKPMWGTWWLWDARLTSELVLLFLYLGVIGLYNAFSDKNKAGEAAGILALVGVINLPIIHYSVVWWNSLHQGASDLIASKGGEAVQGMANKADIDPSMVWPMLINMAAFACFLGAVSLLRFRNELLSRELHRPWVAALLSKGEVDAIR